jgi:hypothetical protein
MQQEIKRIEPTHCLRLSRIFGAGLKYGNFWKVKDFNQIMEMYPNKANTVAIWKIKQH